MATSLKAIVDLAGLVITLGDKLFVANETWTQYRYVVKRLESTLESRKEIIQQYDLGVIPRLKDDVDAVQKELNRVWEELRKRRGDALPIAVVFPNTLERKVQFIKELTTNIESAISSEAEQRTAGASLQDSEVRSDNPGPDRRYVPLKKFQAKVYNALSDSSEGSRPVVFLHGEQGIGKSTLALHIASEASEKDGSFSFLRVIFITCGISKKSAEVHKLLKVRLKLGEEATDADLVNPLGKKQTLIILDDVQDPYIPARVVRLAELLAGHSHKSVKFLITSNLSELCKGCDDSRIERIHLELKHIDKDDARHVLARHTRLRLPAGRIPEELQVCFKCQIKSQMLKELD